MPLYCFKENPVGEARSSSSLHRPTVLLMEGAAPEPRAEDGGIVGICSEGTYQSCR